MAIEERIAIVGAGIIGCAIAFELSRRGASVVVFDRRELGGGATQASAGILAPFTEAHEGGRLFEMTVRGLSVYDDFVARVRAVSPFDFEYRRSGTLEVADTAERATELVDRLTSPWASSAGVQWLDRDELLRRAPAVRADALGGLLCPVHGHIAVLPFAAALADAATRLGARFEFGRTVNSEDLLREGFDRVVLCAGAWTASMSSGQRIEQQLRPVRGQVVRLKGEGVPVPHVLWGSECYIVPWADGSVLVGATSEEVGFDERATVDGVRAMLNAAATLVPQFGSATFLSVHVGLRPATSSGLPILGPSSDPRVIHATGHFRNGILLAPLTAQLVANYVFERDLDPAFSTA